MRRELLSAALLAMLEAATGKNGALVTIPANTTLPYFILDPMPARRGTGSMKDPEEDREYRYQVTSVGRDPRMADWMSDRVQVAIIGRSGNGFTHALVVAGGNIQDRSSIRRGGVEKSGQELYQVVDEYAVKAGR